MSLVAVGACYVDTILTLVDPRTCLHFVVAEKEAEQKEE